MGSKNNNLFVLSVLEDIKKVVAENAEACGRAKESISGAICIFSPKTPKPTNDFHSVRR